MDRVFVSRGGIKLQAAIDNWNLIIENFTVLDVGSSTGGFVDCLLQNGAAKVYAVDTAYGEFSWKLRNDPRVVVMERTNILHLQELSFVIPAQAGIYRGTKSRPRNNGSLIGSGMTKKQGQGENGGVMVDLVTIDAGWTKLELVLPVVRQFLKQDGVVVALLKPHYETQQKFLKKGVVPEELVEEIKNRVLRNVESLGFKVVDVFDSPILGGGGNKEYLLLLTQK